MEKLKVLIIDDEVKICRLINALIDWDNLNLENIGYAHDGFTGLEMIRELKPDLVITDIRMPGIKGVDLITTVRSENIDTEFIIVSGFSDFSYAQTALKMNVVDYLLKPIKKEEINNTILNVKQRIQEKISLGSLNVEMQRMENMGTNDLLIEKAENDNVMFFSLLLKDDHVQYVDALLLEDLIVLGNEQIGYIKASSFEKAHFILNKLNHLDGIRFIVFSAKPTAKPYYDGIYSQDRVVRAVDTYDDARKISELEDINRYIISSFEILDKTLIKENIRLYFSLLRETPYLSSSVIETLFNTMVQKISTVMIEHQYSYEFVKNFEHLFKGYYSIEIIEEQLLQTLNQAVDDIQHIKNNQTHPAVLFINNYIEKNYMESISLEEIAFELKMNPSYLSNLYKKESKQTFREALTLVRIEKTKELLRTTNIPINEIYIMVGYNDQKHFSATFKKYVKLRPSEYRKINQHENIIYL